MKSRFRQTSNPTTLDYQLGWYSFVQASRRRQQERAMVMFEPLAGYFECTLDHPCGAPGCINTERAKSNPKPAAN